MSEGPFSRLPDWLVIGQESWDVVERRNQLLVRALAARHPRARFLFAEQPLRPREVRSWRWPRLRRVAGNVWTIRAVRPLPDRFRRVSDRLEARQVRRAARALGLEDPLVWTQDPRAATLVDDLGARRIVYDLTDDWAAFESDSARRAEVQRRIESLGARAEVVLACSRPLEERAREWSDRVRYLPNAVDPPTGSVDVPRDLASLPRPRIGYVGTLHSARLDVELLARAAELRPDWSVVLIGPDHLELSHRERLLRLPNVHHLGVRPHAQVRAYLEGLDVCLLPHRVDEFTRSLDPLKLYEYLAAGRPIVATPVGNSPDLEEHVTVAGTAEELVASAASAMAEDSPERQAARRAAVADETWEARAADIETALGVRPASAPSTEVSVVIVSFNTRDLLERCLTDLHAQEGVDFETIVVDNASKDGSVEMVRDRFPQAELIELSENLGFGAANNVAFERCRGEFVLLLNSDAFMQPGTLAKLVAVARRRPDAGAVGPRLVNPDGTLQRSAWPFPAAGRLLLEAFGLHLLLRRLGLLEDLGTWRHDEERPVDFLVGACLLLRTQAIADVAGFDEGFWLYGEESDLMRRMSARGWQVVFAPDPVVTHVAGASSSAGSMTRMRHFYAGQMRFVRKHGGPLAWAVARFALLAGSLLRGRWDAARVALERSR